MLSSSSDWVLIYDGPEKQLDLSWVASLCPGPLCSHVYRVAHHLAKDSAPREITWLSDPEAPTVLSASMREAVLGWPLIDGCCSERLRRVVSSGGAAFQVEVSEGLSWQPARVQQKSPNAKGSRPHRPGETAMQDRKSVSAFLRLTAVDGRGGIRIVDLRPATWYKMRLRVTYANESKTIGPSVALCTKCGPPDVPTPRPRVVEEKMVANCMKPKCTVGLPVAAHNLESLMNEACEQKPSLQLNNFRLRVAWAQPPKNGHPIKKYILQQREEVLPPAPARSCRSVDVISAAVAQKQQRANYESKGLSKWTPWREVHAHSLSECLIRSPSRCPASVTSARHILGLDAPSTFSSTMTDMLKSGLKPPPCFIAIEFRVAAVNVLGSSNFSQVTRITKHECPNIFGHPSHSRSADPQTVKSANQPTSPSLESELEYVAAVLRFPFSPRVIQNAYTSSPKISIDKKIKLRQSKGQSKSNHGLYSPAQNIVVRTMVDMKHMQVQ